MGGIGSGYYAREGSKRLISSALELDIRKLKQDNLLIPGIQFDLTWIRNGNAVGGVTVRIYNEYLQLEYIDNEYVHRNQQIDFAKTLCNYGGVRSWLRCPECGCRFISLYTIGKEFACRKCHDLTYDSCNQSELDRIITKYNKAKAKIGGGPGIVAPVPDRPKGMHHKTYERILDQIYWYNYLLVTTVF